jgi:formylglycine-generating enzyme required for sulfatase activity
MKLRILFSVVLFALLLSRPEIQAQSDPAPFLYDTPQEFVASGDFDGDGKRDLVIVDKLTGKFRVGYQQGPSVFLWVDNRPSGLHNVTGFSVGKLIASNQDALIFASADDNQVNMVDASSRTATAKPVPVAFTVSGPNTLVAVDIGGAGNTPLDDLYLTSIYNSPDPNLASLLRNDGKQFGKLAELPIPGAALHARTLPLKPGASGLICSMIETETGNALRLENLSSGKPVTVAEVTGLPAGADYAVGNFGASDVRDFIIFKPGETKLIVRSLAAAPGDTFQFTQEKSFNLGQPVQRVLALGGGAEKRFMVVSGGQGDKADLYTLDSTKGPVLVQSLPNPGGDTFSAAVPLAGGFMVLSEPSGGKFSTKYQAYDSTPSTNVASTFGSLPSLADNDNITIPDIHERLVRGLTVTNEVDMKPYTNTIPGTQISYSMVAIPSGEFVMGSPENEPDRKPDEGPQHKVKISPFWMGQFEITWTEYELFMYPDTEKQMRETNKSDEKADKLADAVSHPSRPYVEMSFGMGKEGFPAIAMTQHAANKYCQWLSAKTGHFYRLPTEAEWEYACRAGTTTRYFFGEDASQLPQYAWFEQNSDFKYQKIGKKKPNPWGLYDIYGNVVEWVLDQYDANFYELCADKGTVTDPWNKAVTPYPHAVKGGSWDDEAKNCRTAARRGSDRSWKMQDPQLPKSIWYFTDAQFIGFRLVRPLKVPPPEELQKYWTSGVERE